MIKIKFQILLVGVLLIFNACQKSNVTTPAAISPGNDPNFTIVPHSDKGLSSFNRKVVVFGIDIYAVLMRIEQKDGVLTNGSLLQLVEKN